MIRSLTLLAVALFASACKKAPTESSPPKEVVTKEYQLTVPKDFSTAPLPKPYANWKASLIKNLGYKRSKIYLEEFLLTDLILLESGSDSGNQVYVSYGNPSLFFIHDINLLINFEEKIIGTGGTGGMSSHRTLDEKYSVIIHPTSSDYLYGVPLGDPKLDYPRPVFSEPRRVTFKFR